MTRRHHPLHGQALEVVSRGRTQVVDNTSETFDVDYTRIPFGICYGHFNNKKGLAEFCGGLAKPSDDGGLGYLGEFRMNIGVLLIGIEASRQPASSTREADFMMLGFGGVRLPW